MKLSNEQLATWFYTAMSAFFQDGAEKEWIEHFNSVKGRERSGMLSGMLSGMKQGVNDALTMIKEMPRSERERIDALLATKDLPSLIKMQANLKKKHIQILKRGRIRNDEEYYIIAEILSDLEFDVTKDERVSLEEMSFSYGKK